MTTIIQLIEDSLAKVLLTFAHNWPYLLASILIGVLIKLYLDTDKVAAFLQKSQKGGVLLATAAAVGTPLCSCGTTAIVIGMMASFMPWAPIVAFMVASPLSSPEGMVYTAGLFGWPFAIAGFVGSILLGLAGGLIAGLLDRAGWLKNQARYAPTAVRQTVPASLAIVEEKTAQSSCGCGTARTLQLQPAQAVTSCGCGTPKPVQTVQLQPARVESTFTNSNPQKFASQSPCGCNAFQTQTQAAAKAGKHKVTPTLAGLQLLQDGLKLLVMFFSFAFLGYMINGLIPPAWITALFGGGKAYSVPLAATLGLPFYINSEGSLPLIRAMLDSGMSQGAALAFLIAGSGTSIGAIAGALSIAKWRVIAVVVGTLWAGAVVLGIAYDLILTSGLI
jgi:uncharacterized membrane protein YraQ (UPF0718 family)